jgi:FtsZ-binding cell division protein ZapB
MLGERIALVEHEIESLREKIDKTSTDISVADRKRAELVEKNEKLKRAGGVLEDTLVDFEDRVKGLLARLPSPIQSQVKPLSQRIPTDPEDTKLSLGERFQNVIGILNEVNKFNGVITVTSEVRELPGGGSAEVAAMYLGVGMAYYANKANEDESLDIAGVGVPGEDGWNWKPVNEAAPEIRRLIAIFRNEEVADFVQTPIEIQ